MSSGRSIELPELAPHADHTPTHVISVSPEGTQDVEKAGDASDKDKSRSAAGRTRSVTYFMLRYASHPAVRRALCLVLLFTASEAFPFLGMAILHGSIPLESSRDVARASAIGASIVAALYVLMAVLMKLALPSCALNQAGLVILAVETAVCLMASCFTSALGTVVDHQGTAGGGELRTLVLDILVASMIGMFISVLSPVVFLPLVGMGIGLTRTEKDEAEGTLDTAERP
ncbi:hypothetical protein C8Q74DRAFT_1366189 [Fomes fomentarius]|nr:hypothetical protein C8Q74DRAFT_1366189 [Fomes fomentarius]